MQISTSALGKGGKKEVGEQGLQLVAKKRTKLHPDKEAKALMRRKRGCWQHEKEKDKFTCQDQDQDQDPDKETKALMRRKGGFCGNMCAENGFSN